MSYFFKKKLLQKKFFFLCKTIELFFMPLKLYKNKTFSSKKIINLFFFFLNKNDFNHFFIFFIICHLVRNKNIIFKQVVLN